MMESTDHSRWKKLLPPLLLFLVVLAVSLHYCLWKQGMFIDEIYTFGLSNSRYMPYIGGGSGDLLPEQLLTREDFFDYLAVTEDEIPFDYSSVRYNQAADVHPPLHYWIINFASSLAKGHFSKWIGLIPDLIIYLGTVLLLYVLASELFVPYLKNSGEKLQTVRQARWIAALTALLYGLSTIGLSTMLMIRMYVLMSFFTVLLALLVLREIRNPAISCEIGIGWTICLGLMTQYYYVFYAFFLCTCTVILFLCKKQWKSLLRFSLFAFAGVVLMLLWFPAVITQMTADKMVSGGSAIENFENLSAWPSRLRYYFGQIRHGMPAAVLLSFFSIAGTLVALLWRTRSEEKSQKPPYSEFVVLFFPVIPTIMTAAILSHVV